MNFFFQFPRISFFHRPSLSGVRTGDVSSKILLLEHVKYFYWNMSFCDPQIEGIPKCAISIEFPLCSNSLFSKITILKPFIQVSIRNVPPSKEYYFEHLVLLCLASQSLKSENAIVVDRSCFSNRFLSETIGLSSLIRISIESLTLVVADSIEKQLILILASKSC